MTDDRLIALLAERPPEQLSGDELAAIRGRLADSPALREAIVGELRLEQALHQTVGQFRLPVELLLAKAAAVRTTASVAKLFGWGSVTALVLGIAGVGTLMSSRRDAPDAQPVAIARFVDDEPASPSDRDRNDGPPHPRLSPTALRQTTANDHHRHVVQPRQDDADPGELFFADAEEAAAWRESLEPVSGEVSQSTIGDRSALVLRGTQVLRQDWPEAGRMRLQLAGHDRFRIHLSHTAQRRDARGAAHAAWPAVPSSLTLEYFAQPQPLWVAWVAARRANQTLPETLALAAHDAGGLSRLGAGTIDLGYRQGQLRMSHGPTELLVAPLAGPPDLVVFEGDAVLHGLAFAEGLPGDEKAVAPFDPSTPRPDKRPWHMELPPGTQWNVLAEGRVELLAEDSQAPVQVYCSLPSMERQEIVFQLEDPLPGTGIFLGDEHGEIRCRLGIVATDLSDQVCFALAKQGDPLRPADGPPPLCPPRPWFKLAFAAGRVNGWFGCDGTHWSPLLGPELPLEGSIARAGVYCLPGPGTRSIRVAQFMMGEPSAPPPQDLFGQLSRAPARDAWGLGRSPVLSWRP